MVLMSKHTRYDAQFESSLQCESHFLSIFLCYLVSPFSEMAVLLEVVGTAKSFL